MFTNSLESSQRLEAGLERGRTSFSVDGFLVVLAHW